MAGGAPVRKAHFESWLAPFFTKFVELKRACGARYCNQVHLLMQADRFFAREVADGPLTRDHLVAYLATRSNMSSLSLRGVVQVLWQALAHARRHGASVEALPARPRSRRDDSSRLPHIFSSQEFEQLVKATLRPRRFGAYARITHVTLFGLLYTTGIVPGEGGGPSPPRFVTHRLIWHTGPRALAPPLQHRSTRAGGR